ncbi:DEAD/DEAH box helicase, partial [bacterium]|nr:DEAD/DEAH box helicase [bacterium]
MTLEQVLDAFRDSPEFMANVTAWRKLPARAAVYSDFPEVLDPRLAEALRGRGISRLYSHQAEAIRHILDRRHTVVVTPTASGKTLCYNLPVLQSVLTDSESRALYLFPTKALSQDQVDELHGLIEPTGADIRTFTFDGDTPASARKAVRSAGHIVVTNPDMLHQGILPHHTGWVKLFENLRFVVVDEVHFYRGVFGSHLANVLRRLKRICAFYGSSPLFIGCSATIANPKELFERLIEEQAVLVDRNGAPRGEKHFIFYNPPVVNAELGIRRSSIKEAQSVAKRFLASGVQTIIFVRSRLRVEILLTYLKETFRSLKRSSDKVRGYRGG